jgi:ATP-dependent Clp protease ATP-binding subunit ClpA
MQLANQQAQRFNREYIGTEHVLLGLIEDGSGVAANVLKNLDIDLRKIRLEIEKVVQSGTDNPPQTPRAKKVIECAMDESRNLNHNYVGTEHILLGLLRFREGVAAQVLMDMGINLADVRDEVVSLLNHVPKDAIAGRLWPGVPVSSAETTRRHEVEQRFKDHPEVVSLKRQIEKLQTEKEAAVAGHNFEQAASIREQQISLRRSLFELYKRLAE